MANIFGVGLRMVHHREAEGFGVRPSPGAATLAAIRARKFPSSFPETTLPRQGNTDTNTGQAAILRNGTLFAPAFTLIELVISAALMSIILIAGYVCLSAGLSSRAMVEARADLLQNARVALSLVAADLRAACPLDDRFEFLGMDRMMEGTEADNLDFATRHYTPRREGESDFCEVSYFLERNPQSGEFSLWRRRDTYPDDSPLAGGGREEILRGLTGLRFEYYDGLDWFDEWGDPEGKYRGQEQDSLTLPDNLFGMPDAVRITLSLPEASSPRRLSAADESEPSVAVYETVVRLNLAPISAERSAGGASGSNGSSGRAANGPSGQRSGW